MCLCVVPVVSSVPVSGGLCTGPAACKGLGVLDVFVWKQNLLPTDNPTSLSLFLTLSLVFFFLREEHVCVQKPCVRWKSVERR